MSSATEDQRGLPGASGGWEHSAADFLSGGEKTREEITDLMAGGEAMAELEAEVESYMGSYEGQTPWLHSQCALAGARLPIEPGLKAWFWSPVRLAGRTARTGTPRDPAQF